LASFADIHNAPICIYIYDSKYTDIRQKKRFNPDTVKIYFFNKLTFCYNFLPFRFLKGHRVKPLKEQRVKP